MWEAFSVTLWFGSVLAWLGLAIVVAVMAEDRGRPPLLWLVLALAFPLLTLVVLLVLSARDCPRRAPELPTQEEAVEHSRVARHLAGAPNSSVHALTQATRLPEQEVLHQLRALQDLGRAVRDDTGRLTLSPA